MLDSIDVFIHVVRVVNDEIFTEVESVLEMLFMKGCLRRLKVIQQLVKFNSRHSVCHSPVELRSLETRECECKSHPEVLRAETASIVD